MKEIAITVKEVGISYKNIKRISIHQSLLKKGEIKRADIFEAVKGVSFEVEKGEILGIIGKNGSGKSTLLRSIAGIFQPDRGEIDTHGYKVALMSIGVGFKPEITGRENIITSGLLMGFRLDYIQQKLDEIIEFSELGEFIDKPVRTYSSGMYSKLSFAITAIMDADIMLVDEVLSVGDEKFKKKSYEKMKELILQQDRTVLIVSHDMNTLKDLCNRVMWIHNGEVREIGLPEKVLSDYKIFMK